MIIYQFVPGDRDHYYFLLRPAPSKAVTVSFFTGKSEGSQPDFFLILC
jgi:hypothetical protein